MNGAKVLANKDRKYIWKFAVLLLKVALGKNQHSDKHQQSHQKSFFIIYLLVSSYLEFYFQKSAFYRMVFLHMIAYEMSHSENFLL